MSLCPNRAYRQLPSPQADSRKSTVAQGQQQVQYESMLNDSTGDFPFIPSLPFLDGDSVGVLVFPTDWSIRFVVCGQLGFEI